MASRSVMRPLGPAISMAVVGAAAGASAAAAEESRGAPVDLVQMQVIVRHGARTPTDKGSYNPSQFKLAERTEEPWAGLQPAACPGEELPPPKDWFPAWQGPQDGQLTARGEEQLRELGRQLGASLARSALAGGPGEAAQDAAVYARSSAMERTVASARALLAGLAETAPERLARPAAAAALHSRPARDEYIFPNYAFMPGKGKLLSRHDPPSHSGDAEAARRRVADGTPYPGPLEGPGVALGGAGLNARQLMDGICMRANEGAPLPASLGDSPAEATRNLRLICAAAVAEFGERVLARSSPAAPAAMPSTECAPVVAAVAASCAPLFAEILDRIRLLAAQQDDDETAARGLGTATGPGSRNRHLAAVVAGERRAEGPAGVGSTDPAQARRAVAGRAAFPAAADGAREPDLVVMAGHDSTLIALCAALAGTLDASVAAQLGRDGGPDHPAARGTTPWPSAASSLRVEVYRRGAAKQDPAADGRAADGNAAAGNAADGNAAAGSAADGRAADGSAAAAAAGKAASESAGGLDVSAASPSEAGGAPFVGLLAGDDDDAVSSADLDEESSDPRSVAEAEARAELRMEQRVRDREAAAAEADAAAVRREAAARSRRQAARQAGREAAKPPAASAKGATEEAAAAAARGQAVVVAASPLSAGAFGSALSGHADPPAGSPARGQGSSAAVPVDVGALLAGLNPAVGLSRREAADRASAEMQRLVTLGTPAAAAEAAVWAVLSPALSRSAAQAATGAAGRGTSGASRTAEELARDCWLARQ
ncbi:hypothetical protein FNF31_07410 [Cafeteria roenbergensis]|uniref:Histidine acid phosphatase n=2 Tax=Cafeteria roenbergensis TaxID=33653 RepID=A0A5A8C6N5_CAFRO|nr:hypothetical protein FNF31_07410 [Cafeteria roenbergensis]